MARRPTRTRTPTRPRIRTPTPTRTRTPTRGRIRTPTSARTRPLDRLGQGLDDEPNGRYHVMRVAPGPASRRRTSMRDDPAVIALVISARDGDQRAWDEIVDRYAPLVWAICRRYQLSRSDTD